MTTSVDTIYGSWPATTPPFISKYGVVTNPSTSLSTGVVFDPYGVPPSLFINGEHGIWYDPSDFSTLFQDAAGTTPVTAVGQPVGKILDKSGRGNHATQATSTKRPILNLVNGKYSLLFDGIDDALATGSIDFTATDKMTVVAGVRKLASGVAVILELSANVDVNADAFNIAMNTPVAATWYASLGNTTQGQLSGSIAGFVTPVTDVLVSIYDRARIGNSKIVMRANGVIPTTAYVGPGSAGNFGNYPLFIGSRAGTSLPFNGNLYSLIVRGALSTDAQIAAAETYANSRTGAY